MNFAQKRKIVKLQNLFIQFIQIAIGTAFVAFSVSCFLLPNQLSVGGFTGIGTVTYYFSKIPIGTTVLILNIPLFIISLIKNRKKFFIKCNNRNYIVICFFKFV